MLVSECDHIPEAFLLNSFSRPLFLALAPSTLPVNDLRLCEISAYLTLRVDARRELELVVKPRLDY